MINTWKRIFIGFMRMKIYKNIAKRHFYRISLLKLLEKEKNDKVWMNFVIHILTLMVLWYNEKFLCWWSKICWNNFQVWVLRQNSSNVKIWPMWKIQIFQKINFSKKYFGDEFLLGWVLTIGNDCLDVSKGVANPEDCCKWFWWLQNSHKKWNIFEPKICGLEFSILWTCGIIGWDWWHKFSRCPEWSYLLPSNFWAFTFTFLFLPTSFS